MGDREMWPDYLIERATQPPPEDCGVVPGTTPVVSFGHPLNPKVATLGINPSSREFVDRNGQLLVGDARRLATLRSLGLSSFEEVAATHAQRIVNDCANYFERKPYAWFRALDQVLAPGLGVSYFDKTACHLDLVQWATDPSGVSSSLGPSRGCLEAIGNSSSNSSVTRTTA